MKAKNIMLLGFVNKAVEYLDRHMDEEPDSRLAELKNIDLASIRDELSDNLDASLGTMQSTMSTLLKAGNEAFDEFIEDTHGKNDVEDQFNRMFDVDFDNNKKNSQDELARLLAFYNLENDFVESYEPDDEIIGEDFFEPEEEDEFLSEIRKNATNDDTDSIMPIEHDDTDDEAIDSIFTEIVEHENSSVENTLAEAEAQIADIEVSVEEESIENNIEVEEKEDTIETVKENIVQEDNKAEEIRIIENPLVDTVPEKEVVNELIEEIATISINPIENPAVDKFIETIVDDIPEVVEAEENILEDVEVVEPVSKEDETQEYVSSLIDDLREQLVEEEKQKELIENKNKEVYNHIAKLYPYLPKGFAKSVYELKENIAVEYPVNKEVIVLHRVVFNSIENLRKFAEIALNHDYTINADENKKIVDIFKKFTNSEGKILTNIYEIANQGYLLEGEYEGYNVLLQD